jgi:hypothetical protein
MIPMAHAPSVSFAKFNEWSHTCPVRIDSKGRTIPILNREYPDIQESSQKNLLVSTRTQPGFEAGKRYHAQAQTEAFAGCPVVSLDQFPPSFHYDMERTPDLLGISGLPHRSISGNPKLGVRHPWHGSPIG